MKQKKKLDVKDYISPQANVDWWLDYASDDAGDWYIGGLNKTSFGLELGPLNRGTRMRFNFVIDKDSFTGLDTEGYLELTEQKNCDDKYNDRKPDVYKLGDIPIEDLVKTAISILKVFAPSLLVEKKIKAMIDGDEESQ